MPSIKRNFSLPPTVYPKRTTRGLWNTQKKLRRDGQVWGMNMGRMSYSLFFIPPQIDLYIFLTFLKRVRTMPQGLVKQDYDSKAIYENNRMHYYML